MKKGRRITSIITSLLSLTALVSCKEDYKYPKANWKDEFLVNVGGKDLKFEDFYKTLDDSKASVSAMYSVAKNVLAQLVTPVTDSIRNKVETKISDLQNTWKSNARTNQTSKKEEMEKTFESENVEDLDELRHKYIAEEQNTANADEFYDINADGSDKSYKYYISEDVTKDYVKNQAPYHVSHILIKLDASESRDGWWDGKISADDAKQIDNVVSMLTSSDSFGSIAQIASDDEGSAKQYGELYTSGDSAMVAMEKTTSYINEFKLGLYAYDAVLNPKTVLERNAIRGSLRVPGQKISLSTTGDHKVQFSYDNETEAAPLWSQTQIGSGKAFGIPLSAAFTLGYEAETEKNLVTNNSVDFASESQYPRNILFNNYFNYHGVSFIYDDTDEYNAAFVADANKMLEVAKKTNNSLSSTTIAKPEDVEAVFPKKYEEYKYVKAKLDKIKDSNNDYYKFAEVETIKNKLVGYNYYDTSANKTGPLTPISGNKKILVDKNPSGDYSPVVVVRGGSSGSYQGIHFITINNDPFVDNSEIDATTTNKKHEYYRTNIPKSGASADSADSTSYQDNPSFINFVTGDYGSNTTYNTRRDSLYKSIKASDPSIEYKLYESNVKKFNEKFKDLTFKNPKGDDVKVTFESFINTIGLVDDKPAVTENRYQKIQDYIAMARDGNARSNNESLDQAWETYVQMLAEQEKSAPRGILPQVCVSAFEAGSLEGMEGVCHVKK